MKLESLYASFTPIMEPKNPNTKHSLSGPSLQSKILTEFQSLVEIVRRLRGPDGCPWDKEQTQKSLTQYAIEEAHELAEAIEGGNQKDVKEELGDFLFQVVLQSQVAQDENHFDLADVIAALNEKMTRRHPHVFGEEKAADSKEVLKNWEKLKAAENKKAKPVFSYPRSLPALQAAYKIGVKTEGYKFDWDNEEQVFEKVREEFLETEKALKDLKQKTASNEAELRHELEHEIGDLLFSAAQLARHVDMEPEQCLREANRRFEKRFNKVLELSGLDKERFSELSLDEKEELWKKAKLLT